MRWRSTLPIKTPIAPASHRALHPGFKKKYTHSDINRKFAGEVRTQVGTSARTAVLRRRAARLALRGLIELTKLAVYAYFAVTTSPSLIAAK